VYFDQGVLLILGQRLWVAQFVSRVSAIVKPKARINDLAFGCSPRLFYAISGGQHSFTGPLLGNLAAAGEIYDDGDANKNTVHG
jgi:hypothetical protein